MNKILVTLLIISAILISGCVSSVEPVNPEDVVVTPSPLTMKEFQESEITVNVLNNATLPVDSVKVISFDPFTVQKSGVVNIPAKTEQGMSSVALGVRIGAPGFKEVSNTTMLTISYACGKDKEGKPIIKTKTVPVQTTVLPDAKLQFVGFVRGPESKREAEVATWTLEKGGNATITFSVKNEGKTTIDENTLRVVVEIENKRIGGNTTLPIDEAMARGGTSYTEAVVLPVYENAPNGETDVNVKLLMGDKVIDTKKLLLKVKLT